MPISFIGPAAADDHALPVHASLYRSHGFDRILLASEALPPVAARIQIGLLVDDAFGWGDDECIARYGRIDSDGEGASAADLLLVPPGSLKQVAQTVRLARRTAAHRGRYPGFLIAVTPVLGATEAAASQRAAGVAVDSDTLPLIGTPEQIARALMDFYDIGIEHILLRGSHPEQDAVEWGRDLIPLMRRKVTQRDGMLAMLAG